MNDAELERRFRLFREKQIEHIERTGRTLVGVFGEGGKSGFVYTIGNALKGLPELLLVITHDDGGLLNALSKVMIERGAAFDDQEVVRLPGMKCSVCIVDASDDVKDLYTCQAKHLVGPEYRVQQVVVPDTKGLFPWQPGCAKPYSDVKIHRAKPLN